MLQISADTMLCLQSTWGCSSVLNKDVSSSPPLHAAVLSFSFTHAFLYHSQCCWIDPPTPRPQKRKSEKGGWCDTQCLPSLSVLYYFICIVCTHSYKGHRWRMRSSKVQPMSLKVNSKGITFFKKIAIDGAHSYSVTKDNVFEGKNMCSVQMQ